LPYGDYAACNVEAQRADPDSILNLTRDLIRVRKDSPDLTSGAYATLPVSDDRVWAWQRGDSTLVACNFSDEPAAVPTTGTIRIATTRTRDGERIGGTLRLDAWEAAIVDQAG
jgi:alpha-glucosidase